MKSNIFSKLTVVAAIAVLAPQAQAITWTSHNGHDYAFVQTSGLTWEEAQDAAKGQATGSSIAYLACIGDQVENEFVFSLIPFSFSNNINNQAWLGGYQDPDASSSGNGWHWINGEQWNFTAWQNGEPNDWMSTQEDRLTMNHFGTSTWNDLENPSGDLPPVFAYFVERESVPDGGSSLALLGLGTASLMALRRKTT